MGTYRKNGNIVQDFHIITNESKEYKMQVETINGKKKYLTLIFILFQTLDVKILFK
jgi:hypothetical protein